MDRSNSSSLEFSSVMAMWFHVGPEVASKGESV